VCAKKLKIKLVDGVLDQVRVGCNKLVELNDWANGRDVKKMFTETQGKREQIGYLRNLKSRRLVDYHSRGYMRCNYGSAQGEKQAGANATYGAVWDKL
jgi:hypothetical protein